MLWVSSFILSSFSKLATWPWVPVVTLDPEPRPLSCSLSLSLDSRPHCEALWRRLSKSVMYVPELPESSHTPSKPAAHIHRFRVLATRYSTALIWVWCGVMILGMGKLHYDINIQKKKLGCKFIELIYAVWMICIQLAKMRFNRTLGWQLRYRRHMTNLEWTRSFQRLLKYQKFNVFLPNMQVMKRKRWNKYTLWTTSTDNNILHKLSQYHFDGTKSSYFSNSFDVL